MAQVAEDVKSVQSQILDEMTKKADEINKSRTGKGTRVSVGQTRGRHPQVITWEAFDDSQPETLPTTISEFMELTGTKDEAPMVSYLVDGFNKQAYTSASDPIAEYVNPEWDEDTVARFRVIVRNYSKDAEVSLEDAVSIVKPGIEKAFQRRKASAVPAQA